MAARGTIISTATTTKDRWCGGSIINLTAASFSMVSTATTTKDKWCGCRWYDSDGSKGNYALYSYNDKGQLVRQQVYYSSGRKADYYLYSYNDSGQVVRKQSYGSDGSKGNYWLYSHKKTAAEESKERGKKCLSPQGAGLVKNDCAAAVAIHWFCINSQKSGTKIIAAGQVFNTGCREAGGTLAACALLAGTIRAQIVGFKEGSSSYSCTLEKQKEGATLSF